MKSKLSIFSSFRWMHAPIFLSDWNCVHVPHITCLSRYLEGQIWITKFIIFLGIKLFIPHSHSSIMYAKLKIPVYT